MVFSEKMGIKNGNKNVEKMELTKVSERKMDINFFKFNNIKLDYLQQW